MFKAVNLVAAAVWSFSLIFVLVRQFGLADYSALIVISALGSYLMVCDLGLSAVVYARMRSSHLSANGHLDVDRNLGAGVISAYFVLSAIAVAAFAAICFTLPIGSGEDPLGFSLYFAGLTLALPWTAVRAVLGAAERYIRFEALELGRRVFNILLVLALYKDLPFVAYTFACLFSWVVVFYLVRIDLSHILGPKWLRHRRSLRSTFVGAVENMNHAGRFSLLEFGVFNLPYLLLPVLYAAPQVLVAFDVFYKITRFGAQSNSVSFETMLPTTTRALHAGDSKGVAVGMSSALALSFLASTIGSVAVLFYGDIVFENLLGDATLIPDWLRACMAAMLFADVFRAGGALLLLNTGRIKALLPASYVGALTLLLLGLVTAMRSIEFSFFMLAYVAIFSGTSLVYFVVLIRRLRSAGRPATYPQTYERS